jgi:hypothetical protein
VRRAPARLGILAAVILLSATLPLAVLFRSQGQWRRMQDSLRQQAGQWAQLAAENQRLSNQVARLALTPRLSDEQLLELLRLRSELGELRRQTNRVRELRDENLRLQTRPAAGLDSESGMSEAERAAALAAETLAAGRRIAEELPGALQRYAQAHTNATPTEFSELRRYFPNTGRRLPGLFLFEFVRDTGPEPGDTLVLREGGSREGPDGQRRKVYSFADGRVEEALAANGEFEDWEKARGITQQTPDR